MKTQELNMAGFTPLNPEERLQISGGYFNGLKWLIGKGFDWFIESKEANDIRAKVYKREREATGYGWKFGI